MIKSRRLRYAGHIPKMEEGLGVDGRTILEWRWFHNEELHSLYRSPNVVRVNKSTRLRWAGHVARMGESRSAFKILTLTLTEKRSLGRSRV